MTPTHYVKAVEVALRPLADPMRASAMSDYLLGQFPFLGLAAPVRRAVVKPLAVAPFASEADLLQAARLLWRKPEREFRYTAVDLLRQQHRLLTPAALPQLQKLLLDAPWWETVDGLSAVVGRVLRTARDLSQNPLHDPQTTMDAWLAHPSVWVRRSAMLHQLGWRLDTDPQRLQNYALQLADEKEFFIRKAIGWALRDYARWNPQWVRSFLATHGKLLSALTLREAGKHL
jgi:3-methyladenine DNA glycosylase AlkD